MKRLSRSTDIRSALRSRQRGFLLNPARFGGGGGGGGGSGDPNIATVLGLFHGDDTNGSTNIVDSAPSAFAVTRTGTNCVISTTKSQWGGSSIRFAGTGGFTYGTTSTFAFMHQPSGKWTWEGWVAFDSFAADRVLFSTSNGSTANSGIYCAITSTRGLDLEIYNATNTAGSSTFVTTTGVGGFPNDANLHHLAICWDCTLSTNTLRWFVDGTQIATGNKSNAASSATTSAAVMKLGGYSSSYSMLGYMDDIRISSMVRYTGSFTAPTGPFSNS